MQTGDLFFIGALFLLSIIAIIAFYVSIGLPIGDKKSKDIYSEKINVVEMQIEENGQTTKPIWDLAKLHLEEYFVKNLSHITVIFWLCLLVMLTGFIIITWGIIRAINTPNSEFVSIIATVSGVITELIGASFLVIYQSTMKQAGSHTEILERINSVGMAMLLLDTMSENDSLKEKTKANLVLLMVGKSYEGDDTEET
jgi:hypothetical protein